MSKPTALYPLQKGLPTRERGTASESVYMHAYEVYCEVYGPQPALIDLKGRGCRGGFGVEELIAFLYAHSFPKAEWRARVNEAFEGLNVN